MASAAVGEGQAETGQLADGSEAFGSGRLLWGYWHACLQPEPLHYGSASGPGLLRAENVRSRPRAGRLWRGRGPLPKRWPGHGDRLPDLSWPGKRFVDRGRWHEGRPRMAPGRTEQDAVSG